MINNIYYKYYGLVYFTRVHLIRVYIHRVLMAASKWPRLNGIKSSCPLTLSWGDAFSCQWTA